MEESAFPRRVSALKEKLRALSCDTIWVIQPENRRYLSGFRAEDSQINESSGSLLITQSHCLLVTDSRYATEAEAEAVHFQVHILKEGFVAGFCEAIGSIGTRRLGFEESFVTCALHRELLERINQMGLSVDLVPLEGIVEDMREAKDEGEIEIIEASADLISGVLDELIPWLKPGIKEKDVAWQIECLAREAGAEGMAFPPIVASGPNSALPHAVPTEREIQLGEPVILDVGVKLDGYCSDMTRTVFLGEPEDGFKKIYNTVRSAQLAALREIRPGVATDHPDATARKVIGDAGFGEYFGHGLGHGVGLATHERPRLSPLRPSELKQGSVVTVEPGIYIPGRGGVRLEEMVVVESDGPRIITRNSHFYDFDR